MTEECADRSGDLDTKILVDVEGSTGAVEVSQHGGGDADGENVVGIGEEAYACDEAGADVVPPMRILDAS